MRHRRAINCGMAKGDRSSDPVSKAFQRLLEDAGGTPVARQTGYRPDWLAVALSGLALALVGLGILALFVGWLLPDG